MSKSIVKASLEAVKKEFDLKCNINSQTLYYPNGKSVYDDVEWKKANNVSYQLSESDQAALESYILKQERMKEIRALAFKIEELENEYNSLPDDEIEEVVEEAKEVVVESIPAKRKELDPTTLKYLEKAGIDTSVVGVLPDVEYTTDKRYFSELPKDFLSSLTSCIVDKTATSCGATHYYICNDEDVIIAVPRNYLIKSKCSQHLDLLGVTSEETNLENVTGDLDNIVEYIDNRKSNNQPIKIMVTFDAVDKIFDAAEMAGVNVDDIKLIVDEYQFLLTDTFKTQSHTLLYRTLSTHKNTILVSATPIERQFLFKELQNFKIVKINWSLTTQKKLDVVYAKNVQVALKKRIQDKMKGKIIPNLYIFCNSVRMIKQICKSNSLTSDVVKIVCANTPDNVKILSKKLPIRQLDDKREDGSYYPVNFITSAAFAGVDLFDADAQTIIVSDKAYMNTLADISLEVKQIIGRARNCDYNKYIPVHIICSEGQMRYDDYSTIEQFAEVVAQRLEKSYGAVPVYSSVPDTYKSSLKRGYVADDAHYYFYPINLDSIENDIVINPKLAVYDLYLWNVHKSILTSFDGYDRAVKASGMEINKRLTASDLMAADAEKIPFKLVWEEYYELKTKENPTPVDKVRINFLESGREYLADTFELLTDTEVARTGYHVGHIKRKLSSRRISRNDNKEVKLIKAIRAKYKVGDIIPAVEVKTFLQGLFDEFGINRTAKGTTMNEFWNTSAQTKYVDGKTVKCVIFQ